jgi:hypothetical protein
MQSWASAPKGGLMFELDYMETYLLPVFVIFMTIIIVGIGVLARKGGK